MKITFATKDVLPYIGQCASVINNKTTMPILSNLLIECTADSMLITAGDGDMSMRACAPIKDLESDNKELACCVDAALFNKALANLKDKIVTVVTNDNNTLTCTYDGGEFSLPYQSARDYPRMVIDPIKLVDGGNLNCNQLFNTINSPLTAVASDELRPIMNGVYLETDGNNLISVASDGHVLIKYTNKNVSAMTDNNAEEQVNGIVIPKKVAALIASIASSKDAQEQVSIHFNNSQMTVEFLDFQIYARLIDGRFPNYNAVIPKESNCRAVINKDSLLLALRRVMTLGNKNTGLVCFEFQSDKLTINTIDYDLSRSAKEFIKCEFAGEPLSIGFKDIALLSVLQNITDENITIGMTCNIHAALITPVTQKENSEYISIIMPMTING